jgi:calcineurin-like phosphoesterase family protein
MIQLPLNRNIWFTSDTHVGHGNIIRYCHRFQFTDKHEQYQIEQGTDIRVSKETIQRMDSCLIDTTNRDVGVDDLLINLGDLAFGGKDDIRRYREAINCKEVWIVRGNHDRYPTEFYSTLFRVLPPNSVLEYNRLGHKYHIVVNHYGEGERGLNATSFVPNPRKKPFKIGLYGHSHGTREQHFNQVSPGRWSMDVGVDNIFNLYGEYAPISLDGILEHLGVHDHE